MTAGGDGYLGSRYLRLHAAGAHIAAPPPGHRFDRRRDVQDAGDELRVRVRSRIGRVQAVDIGQQHQAIRAHHLGHSGREPVVVAIANFRRRHGVVLVDHGDCTQCKQRAERAAGIQVSTPLLGIPQSKQYLGHRDLVRLQQFLVGVGETNLSNGGGGLTLLELELRAGQTQLPPPERNRAGGHQDHVLAPLAQARDVGGQLLQPRTIEPPLRTIDQQRGAHLDDDALGFGQATSSIFAVGDGHGGYNIAIYLSKRPHLILRACQRAMISKKDGFSGQRVRTDGRTVVRGSGERGDVPGAQSRRRPGNHLDPASRWRH